MRMLLLHPVGTKSLSFVLSQVEQDPSAAASVSSKIVVRAVRRPSGTAYMHGDRNVVSSPLATG